MDSIFGLLHAVLSFFASIIVSMSSINRRGDANGIDVLRHSVSTIFWHLQSLLSLPKVWLFMVFARLDVPPPVPPKPTRKYGTSAPPKPVMPERLSSTPAKPTSGKLALLLDPFNLPSEVLVPPSGQVQRRQYLGLRSAGGVIEEEDVTASMPPMPTFSHGQLDRQRLADSLRYGPYATDMAEFRRLKMHSSNTSSRRNSSQFMNHSRFLRTTSGEVMSVPSVLVSTSGHDIARHPKGIRALSAFRPVGAMPQPTSQLVRVSSGVLYSATVARGRPFASPSMLFPQSHSQSSSSYIRRSSRPSSLL